LDNHQEICDFCHVGRIVERKLTYTERFQEDLILIPNISGRVCTYCGNVQYDPFVMTMLYRLLWADLEMAGGSRDKARTYTYRIDPQTRRPNKGQPPPQDN